MFPSLQLSSGEVNWRLMIFVVVVVILSAKTLVVYEGAQATGEGRQR